MPVTFVSCHAKPVKVRAEDPVFEITREREIDVVDPPSIMPPKSTWEAFKARNPDEAKILPSSAIGVSVV